MSDNKQVNQIAWRIARWGGYPRPGYDVSRTCGYCMSGRWEDFYQRFLFPGKTLRDDRLGALVQRLRAFGFYASLEVQPFETGGGLYMYMRLRPVA